MTSPPNILRAEPFQHEDEGLVLQTSTDELRLSHDAITVNVQSGEKVPGSLDGVEVGAVSVWISGLAGQAQPGSVQGDPGVHAESPTPS